MSLYLDHFGLAEPPFRITPHTDFFFTGANRGPTLEALIYAITQDEGIVKVTGEVGSGKTMLCRMLLEKLPPEVDTIYLANPSLSRQEIVGAIADELGLPADGRSTHSLTRALQNALVERYALGRRVVLLIDEAHAMPAESLEEVRLLSNLESKSSKLLQIALFAQPEIDARLAQNDMRQLRERVTQHFILAPLQATEVSAYLEFRMRTAGYRGPSPFTEKAVAAIARNSQGLSRRINILADKALLAAYSAGGHRVDLAEAQTAIRDARFTSLGEPRRRLIPAAAAAGVAVALLFVAYTLGSRAPGPATPAANAAPGNSAPAPGTAAPGAPEPAAATPREGATAPGEPAVAAPPGSEAAAARTSPKPDPSAGPATALAAIPAPSRPAGPAPTAAATPTGIAAPSGATAAAFGPLTRRSLERFDTWSAGANARHYFIQLYAADAGNPGLIENFLRRHAEGLDAEQIRAYRSDRSGRDRLGLIFGEFATRAAAMEAIAALPEGLRRLEPYPRQVSRLQ